MMLVIPNEAEGRGGIRIESVLIADYLIGWNQLKRIPRRAAPLKAVLNALPRNDKVIVS
jgi:hypothetical protein